MFDRVNIRLAAVDDVDGSMENIVQETSVTFPQLDLSTYQGTTRLYSYDLSSSQIRKYSFPELNLQNQKFLGETIMGGYAKGDFVYMLLNNSFAAFQVLNAQNFSTIDTEIGLPGSRNLAVFDGDPVQVMEISEIGIIRYDVNSLGKVIQSDQFDTGVVQPSTQNTCDFNDQYYIGGRFSTIVNKEADVVTSLVSGINSFTQMCRFSPDGTKAAIIVNNGNVVELQIFDITNLPAAVKTKAFNLPNATFSDLYYRDNVINIIGVNFNSSSPQTFFLKFPA
jgi:hypothetical protein